MFFDVWISGPVASPAVAAASRAELLRRIEAVHPVPRHDAEAFVSGAPLKLRRGISEEAALNTLAALQALGAAVEVEANRPAESLMVALDEFDAAEAEARAAEVDATQSTRERLESSNPEIVALVDAAKLVASLDGGVSGRRAIPTPLEMDSVALPPARPFEHVDTRPMGPARLAADAQAAHPQTDEVTAPMGRALELDRPLRAHPMASQETTEMTLPPARPTPAVAGPTAEMAAVVPPRLPGRLAGGRLRQHPGARLGAGVVLGLGLGWALSQPYAGRAERRVAELRAEADRERYRPVEEARARVAALDAEADAASTRAALGAGGIWLVVGAATFAAWWRIT